MSRNPRRFPPVSFRILSVTLCGAVGLAVSSCGGGPSAVARGHRPKPALAASAPPATTAEPVTTTAPPTTTTAPPTTTTAPPTTTTTSPAAAALPPASGTTGPVTSPPLPAPGPGFVAGQVTAVGDSVMLDYQGALEADVPGIVVQAAVSRQWTTGETVLQQMKAAGQLGAVVVVGLGTNGPVTTTDFNAMMAILAGASRVVFVNVHVDRPWQDPNNAVIETGVGRYPNTVLADWNSLATQNPGWLYTTGTHLPIDGPGAQALAALVASEV